MGHISHDTVIVTGQDEEAIARANLRAISLGLRTSGVMCGGNNGCATFCTVPCGSKLGWQAKKDESAARDALVDYLRAHGRGLEWCEVSYGSDNEGARVTRSAWEVPR